MTLEEIINAVEEHQRCSDIKYFIQKYLIRRPMNDEERDNLNQYLTGMSVIQKFKNINKLLPKP